MKKTIVWMLMAALLIGLAACGQPVTTWQEQYDLGLRYLSEGNYEEAAIAFAAAIEIDPKQHDAYIGLADAYVGIGNYEKAIEVLAQAVQTVGETEALTAAQAVLQEQMIPNEKPAEGSTVPAPFEDEPVDKSTTSGLRTERVEQSDGSYFIFEYDSNGNMVRTTYYRPDGSYEVSDFDANGVARKTVYNPNGSVNFYTINEYDTNGNMVRTTAYTPDGSISFYQTYEYDTTGNPVRTTAYNPDGRMRFYMTYEYDTAGNPIRTTEYNPDGSVAQVTEY